MLAAVGRSDRYETVCTRNASIHGEDGRYIYPKYMSTPELVRQTTVPFPRVLYMTFE